MSERIYSRQFHAADGAEDWRAFPEGAYAFFRTGTFATSVRLVKPSAGWHPSGPNPMSTSAATA